MRICHYCKQDIHQAVSCNAPAVYESEGPSYARIPYGIERHAQDGTPDQRCPNCLVMSGMLHHPGCLSEECPACHKALATCRCALMFRHGENSNNRRSESSPVSEPGADGAEKLPPAKPIALPTWRPDDRQREDDLVALRLGRLSGCWKDGACRITVADRNVLHEHGGMIEVIPLGDDAVVVAQLQATHANHSGAPN